ncbi:hypothetical protein OPV22_006988 [Ensete ventricosum]|uniref:Uncharacterized protein n=1 Tax=Ensete ventricosum TaxID=4639 RepID=A0AAV8RMK0_ENSVE|nr:hypothetical protein OPV22_006988 [Ensete ventricosum]
MEVPYVKEFPDEDMDFKDEMEDGKRKEEGGEIGKCDRCSISGDLFDQQTATPLHEAYLSKTHSPLKEL